MGVLVLSWYCSQASSLSRICVVALLAWVVDSAITALGAARKHARRLWMADELFTTGVLSALTVPTLHNSQSLSRFHVLVHWSLAGGVGQGGAEIALASAQSSSRQGRSGGVWDRGWCRRGNGCRRWRRSRIGTTGPSLYKNQTNIAAPLVHDVPGPPGPPVQYPCSCITRSRRAFGICGARLAWAFSGLLRIWAGGASLHMWNLIQDTVCTRPITF